MASRNYFIKTRLDNWYIKKAFTQIEKYNPSNLVEHTLKQLKDQLHKVLMTNDTTIITEMKGISLFFSIYFIFYYYY
jgi:hypothetical protein